MTLTQQIITVAMVVSAVSDFTGREADAKIYQVSGKSASSGSIRASGYLLSEKCKCFYRKSRGSGTDFDYTGDFPACVEAADASVHCRRYGVLYAACAACFLKQKNLTDMDECGIRPALRKKRRELSRIFCQGKRFFRK